MKVMKFGGTSVGTPQRMKEVTALARICGPLSHVRNNQFSRRDFRLSLQEES